MKIAVTGSLGNISKPLVIELVQKGHQVTVISSKAEKQKVIEAIGAKAAIGLLEDVDFLTATFTGADVVYCMVPPVDFFDPNYETMVSYPKIGNNYAQAIRQSGVKSVVHLSSTGAHLDKGTGIILGHHAVENILEELPTDVAITHIRPVAIYYNLLCFLGAIKNTGNIAANYGAEDFIAWVSPVDIGAAVAEEIVSPLKGREVRYVASNEVSCNETAGILGTAIGKPDMKWLIVTIEQMQSRLEAIGMAPHSAAGLAEMNASMHSGIFFEDYYRNKPAVMGKVKMTDFAKKFAEAFNSKKQI
jgi:uncharacterized protein YbjT (DUF2867 family)